MDSPHAPPSHGSRPPEGAARAADPNAGGLDLSPLAWVHDELQRSLQEALSALQRFAHAHRQARLTDLASVDEADLRMARQQLHQAVGAMEMVGLGAAARVLRGMEAAVQRFVARPDACDDSAVVTLERVSAALTDYLERRVRQRPVADLHLFPAYRDAQTLAGAERVHPADLWTPDHHGITMPPVANGATSVAYGPALRAQLDRHVLPVVKSFDAGAAAELVRLGQSLSAAVPPGASGVSAEVATFWRVAAGYFDAVAHGALPADVHGKRAASRVLLQYAGLAQGRPEVSDPLLHELLFLCAQADPARIGEAHALLAVREAFGLQDHQPVDCEQVRLGLFDPTLLSAARDQVRRASDAWAQASDGGPQVAAALATLPATFHTVGRGVTRVCPDTAPLAQAFVDAVNQVGAVPERITPQLALEVATALLFLTATLEDFDPSDPGLADRSAGLAERVRAVLADQPLPPLAPWMEQLYRQWSERQTLGSVVDEVRRVLLEAEAVLDRLARDPSRREGLAALPDAFAQMQGVLSVLALDDAARAALAMRETAQALLSGQTEVGSPPWRSLVHNLGALGFLVDVLGLHPSSAQRGFVFDAPSGELRPLLAQASRTPREAEPAVPPVDVPATGADAPAEDEDAELLAIFIEEAREVVASGQRSVASLSGDGGQLAALTTLRRAFHTLKGSARMVGLAEFGEAAWAMEQVLNARLAEQAPADGPLLALAGEALAHLAAWVDELAAGRTPAHQAAPFQRSSLAMREQGIYLPLQAEATPVPVPEPEEPKPVIAPAPAPPVPEPLEAPVPEAEPAFEAFDEQVKVIGPLRIGLNLFNVYLNEADEWSRCLCNALAEWAVGPDRLPAEPTVGWAHSLAGSSFTVGFEPLGQLARALEHAIERLGCATPPAGQRLGDEARQVPVLAAEALRYLLHQFAAGFLKEGDPAWPERLASWPRPQDWVPVPAPQVVATPVAEAADTPDADLFHVFEEEALDLMPRLGGALRQWVARPDNGSARAEVLRNLHTLKGSARLAGALGLGDLAHQMESAAEQVGSEASDLPALQDLLLRFDALAARLDQLRGGAAPDTSDPPAEPATGPQVAPPATPPADRAEVPAAANGVLLPRVPAQRAAPSTAAAVRVRPELLDRLMGQVGDVMLTRARMEDELHTLRASLQDLTGNLARLRQQLRDLELQTESQVQSRQAQNLQAGRDATASFDPLEFDRYTRVQELTRIMAESVNDVATVQRNLQRAVDVTEDGLVAQGRQSRELQRDLLRTRMVDFDTIAERLHRVVRQAALETGKRARLDLVGAQIEMDRSVLERMAPAFEHLLRNAVVHGIEAPPQREAAGKPAEGALTLTLRQEGNDVTLVFGDDGAGLDLARVREKALALGRLDGAAAPDEAALMSLVFEPGLSTAAEVSELAGRGIGLDVVRNEVLALGGRIEIASEAGRGARFTLVLPLTTAVTQVLLLRAGAFTFGVPASLVEKVHRLDAAIVREAGPVGQLAPDGVGLPLYWAGALLSQSTGSREAGKLAPVLQLRSATQRVLLHVDELLGNQEVVVKHLGPQLSRLPGVSGMTVLASGAVALIYNPVALAVVYGGATCDWLRDAASRQAQQPVPSTPLVLVVDDSITVRRVTQRLLQREGYRVALANDGQQALERMRDEMPVVVLSDIEMPRMDGFELVSHMRADAALKDLPVVMITSRIADKHREHARELGVDHYLGKPYSEETLLALVAGYARLAAPH
ncbi:hybrid sensor histidine kinase/response regulator [Hydrogenophaga sp. OTU3427]|uniref:hybrid sensor histidine kinase/response regulator n=1 Tax=Hydrogenophaga sp. OTU3427 TaxID=3043856 RepID=UPI00313BFAD2